MAYCKKLNTLSASSVLKIGTILAILGLGACEVQKPDRNKFAAQRAQRDQQECKIIQTLPLKIKQSGRWCLNSDLTLVGDFPEAINIMVNGVTIDLGGHKLIGDNNPNSDSFGIFSQGTQDVVVKNGEINGFHYGIRVESTADAGKATNASDIALEKLVLANNRFRAAAIFAKNAKIENVIANNTGGTKLYPDASTVAFEVKGPDCLITNNQINEVMPEGVGFAAGVLFGAESMGCEMSSNRITNSALPLYGRTIGIWNTARLLKLSVTDNYVKGFTYPFMAASGKFHLNSFDGNSCNIANAPKYYSKFDGDEPNKFLNATANNCSESVAVLSARADVNDPRVQYRLAVTWHDNLLFENPAKTGSLDNLEKALVHYQAAAKGGVIEAHRILPDFEKNIRVMRRNAMQSKQ